MGLDLVALFLLVELRVFDDHPHALDGVDVLAEQLVELLADWGVSLDKVGGSRVALEEGGHLVDEVEADGGVGVKEKVDRLVLEVVDQLH